jgi:hypothetical protein
MKWMHAQQLCCLFVSAENLPIPSSSVAFIGEINADMS